MTMRRFGLIGLAALVVMTACAPEPPPPPRVDVDAARQAILEADRAWSETWDDAGTFAASFTDDGELLPAAGPAITGPDNIRDFWLQVLANPGLSLSWQPTSAYVAETGDLGYSVGTHQMTLDDAEGNTTSVSGKYLAVWRKQADGRWKIAADISNTAPAAEEERYEVTG